MNDPTTHNHTHEAVPVQRLGEFLAEYTSWLWGCGATCKRIDKNVGRIAASYGYEADLTMMPRHITVALKLPGTQSVHTFNNSTAHCGINFDLNSSLSTLSWNISDKKLSLDDAQTRFRQLVNKTYNDSARICLLTSLANASFCRLFGGDLSAMTIVFGTTLIGYLCKQLMLARHIDVRAVFFFCALISTILCAAALTLGYSDTPRVALATAVLYLIPGVPYLNSANDMIAKHYVCAFGRFMDAVVLTAMLSAGLCLGLYIMNINTIWEL
ncbi:MAG: threonine/serine exporter family protein [Muribaculaceae bacterium]|nr:threonine/serine exporter family protein [Muribaculaceae bacterium]